MIYKKKKKKNIILDDTIKQRIKKPKKLSQKIKFQISYITKNFKEIYIKLIYNIYILITYKIKQTNYLFTENNHAILILTYKYIYTTILIYKLLIVSTLHL